MYGDAANAQGDVLIELVIELAGMLLAFGAEVHDLARVSEIDGYNSVH